MTPVVPRLLVVGTSPMVETCAACADAAATRVVTLIVERIPGAGYDLAPLAPYPASDWTAFAAAGPELLNLLRLALMADLRAAGYPLATLLGPRASVARDWRPGENTRVEDGANIGPGVIARHNVVVGTGAIIGAGASLGHSVWIGAGAIIGAGAAIGQGTTITAGAIVGPRVRIGRQCELGVAREYPDHVPDRTFVGAPFEEPVRIVAGHST